MRMDRTRSKIAGAIAVGLLVVGLGAGASMAAGGSAYVTSACAYPSLQDNTIVQGDDVYVWVKVTGSGSASGLTWTTVDNSGDNTQGPGNLVFADCTRDGGKYRLYLADGFDSSVLGSYTLTVWNGSKSVSGDGFRVIAD